MNGYVLPSFTINEYINIFLDAIDFPNLELLNYLIVDIIKRGFLQPYPLETLFSELTLIPNNILSDLRHLKKLKVIDLEEDDNQNISAIFLEPGALITQELLSCHFPERNLPETYIELLKRGLASTQDFKRTLTLMVYLLKIYNDFCGLDY